MDRALFLDRDGVLNVDHGYIGAIERFDPIPGVFEALTRAIALDYRLIVITNQSGIARGYFSAAEYAAVERHMIELFAAHAIHFSGIYHCPHHPGGVWSELAVTCDCRKPAPGMILRACIEHDIDPARSVLVGDKMSDLAAGRAANVGHCFLVGAAPQGPTAFRSLRDLVISPTFDMIARAT